jgi:uncharacterized RDD family membrane protein YckC
MKGNETVNAPAAEVGYSGGCAGRMPLPHHHRFSKANPVCADVRMRLLATLFDWMLVGLLIMFTLLLVEGNTWQVGEEERILLADVTVLLVCVPFLYFVGFWCLSDSSPGKMLLSLHIVDAKTYEPLTGAQCLVRYFGYLLNICSLGLGLVGIFDKRKSQGWHDKLAGTIVIRQ